MNHYETLGVERSATKEDITRAYRKKAVKQHPDAGGDPAQFKALVIAYETLHDDASRDHYDKTGQQPDGRPTPQMIVAGMVLEAFTQDQVDPVRWMCNRIDESRAKMKQMKNASERQRQKFSRRLAKFESANVASKNQEAKEFIANQLRAKIASYEAEMATYDVEVELATATLTFLNDLSCPADIEGMQPFSSASWPPPFSVRTNWTQ